jgi:TonB family protein
LAARVAEALRKVHAKKVIVAELQGPEGQAHPVGKFLADRLTESLQRDFPDLDVIDRSQRPPIPNNPKDSGTPGVVMKKVNEWARALGANFVITGSFAKVSHGIGASISAMRCDGSPGLLGPTTALIPISDEITALSPDPIPSPKDGISRGGIGGTSIPVCVYCPVPSYTDKARAAKLQGSVVLEVVVNPDGQAGQIKVSQGASLGLDESAIKTVKKWKFKPALGPDGNPVAVLVPIEVTFRLYP